MTEIDATPPLRTGFVYALVANDEIVYIGQTTAIAQRLLMHRAGTKNHPPKQFDRAFVLELAVADLSAFEGALIRRFNPPLCRTAPVDNGRDEEVLARLGLAFDRDSSDAFEERRRARKVAGHRRACVRQLAHRHWRPNGFSSVLWRSTVRYLARVNQKARPS